MEPLIHVVVPFVALMLAGLELKKALPISLFALLPDFDALILVHRSTSHSVIVVLLAALPFLLLTYRFKRNLFGYVCLASAAVMSHLALDVFSGFTPILWPLYDYSVWIKSEVVVSISNSAALSSNAQVVMEPTIFRPVSLDAPLLTGGGVIVSVVLLFPVLVKIFKAGWQQIKG